MIKSQLVEKISKKIPQLPERVIAISVGQIIDTMCDALARGRRIEIRDFGGFALKFRASRSAHNPKTGAKVTTLPKYSLRFKPGKEMRARVNTGRDRPIISDKTFDEDE